MQIQENKKIYGGFFVRLAAYLIDMVIVGVIALILIAPLEFAASFADGDNFFTKNLLFQFTFFDIAEYLLITVYFVLMTYFTGATLGKRLLNLKVVSASGEPLTFINVLYRETIGKYLSGIIFGIGYILAAADSEKCALHDRLCDTRVEYCCKLPAVRKIVPVAPAPIPYPVPYPQSGNSQQYQRPAQPVQPQQIPPYQPPRPPYQPMTPPAQNIPPEQNNPPRQ